jgi:uncharacterized membrane protein
VETIYFDTLQFLYHLALAILVGGAAVLGLAAAPAIFASVRSRGEAGAIFGAILGRYDGLAILCVILIVVTSALKAAAFEVVGLPETRLIFRWVALLVLCGATLYASAWANPVAGAGGARYARRRRVGTIFVTMRRRGANSRPCIGAHAAP